MARKAKVIKEGSLWNPGGMMLNLHPHHQKS